MEGFCFAVRTGLFLLLDFQAVTSFCAYFCACISAVNYKIIPRIITYISVFYTDKFEVIYCYFNLVV